MLNNLPNKLTSALAAVWIVVTGIAGLETLRAEESPLYQIPIEAFASLPGFSGAKFSRSGSHLAYYITHKGRRHLVFQHVDGSQSGILPPSGDADIDSFFWATDNVIILQYGFTANRVVFRGKSYETRSISFNIKTKKSKWLGKPRRNSA